MSRNPGPSLLRLLRLWPQARRGLLEPLVSLQKEFGDEFLIPVPGDPVFLLNAPERIHEFLLEKAKVFGRSYFDMKAFMGNGLITSEGDLWENQRKLMMEFFRPKSLENLIPVIEEEVERSVRHFSKVQGQVVRVEEELLRMTLNIVCRGLFSTQVDKEVRDIGKDVDAFMKYVVHRLRSPVRLPFGTPSPAYFRFKEALEHFNQLVESWVESRWENPYRQDLLDFLIRWAKEQKDQKGARRQIRDELITMIIAGHETTTHALCWTLSLLAENPSWISRVREALQALPDFQLKTLKSCEPLYQVYQEGLRLYPPIWYIERVSREDLQMGRLHIPKGRRVAVSPYLIHRHPAYWEHPDHFFPDVHFSKSAVKQRPALSYIPYGVGARSCVGKGLAEMEILIFLAHFLSKFDLEIDPKGSYEMDPLITLRPRHGMPLKII